MAYGYVPPRDPTDVLGRRITAYVIDGLLILIALAAVLSLVDHRIWKGAPVDACSILRARRVSFSDASQSVMCVRVGSRALVWKRGAFLTAEGVAALVGFLDLVVLQAISGASIGKHALGLRVVDEQGQPAGFGRNVARWLLLIVDGGVFLIGLITVLVTHPHRRVGDLAAGTYVVAKSSAGQPIGLVSGAAPYRGPAAMPGYDGPSIPGWAPPTAPERVPAWPSPGTPLSASPGWGTQPQPPTSALPAASRTWDAPPTARPPTPTPTPPPPPPPPRPPAPPEPAPAAPSTEAPTEQWSPAAPVRPAGSPTVSEPTPEPWWDTAIPAGPPDAEEHPS